MAATESHPEILSLLMLLDQAFDKKAWHGPNLRGSIRGLDAAGAAWRPGPGRRSIAEIVLHAAYWKYTARRRLRGDKRGSFALKGSNWFPVADELDEQRWRAMVRLLVAEHEALRAAVASTPADRLGERKGGSRYTNLELIQGIAAHDLYHAGQVQLLKRLRG
jgi:hypothetical protein